MSAENPWVEMLGNLAGDQLAQMEDERNIFHDRMAAQQMQVDNSASRVMERLSRRRTNTPQYSKEVIGIANVLTQFPKMIPVVNAVIWKLTDEMNKAFENAAATYTVGATAAEQAVNAAAGQGGGT